MAKSMHQKKEEARWKAFYEEKTSEMLGRMLWNLSNIARMNGSNPTIAMKSRLILEIQKTRRAAEAFLLNEDPNPVKGIPGIHGTVTGRFSSHQHVGTTKHSAVTQLQAYEYLNRMLPKVNPK